MVLSGGRYRSLGVIFVSPGGDRFEVGVKMGAVSFQMRCDTKTKEQRTTPQHLFFPQIYVFNLIKNNNRCTYKKKTIDWKRALSVSYFDEKIRLTYTRIQKTTVESRCYK